MSDLVTALVPLNQHEPALANTILYEQWDRRKQWDAQTEPGGLVNGVPVNTRSLALLSTCARSIAKMI